MKSRAVPDFAGKRVTVMGLGLFTGGVETIRFLARRGADITVTDLRDEDSLRESLDEIEDIECTFHLGGHIDSDFTDTDYVIANPAVPPASKYLETARENGIPVEYEISLFFRLCAAPIVGVTGSNGKTTTAVMTARFLEAAGRCVHLGGNVGQSLINRVDEISPGDLVVLELSSFQLAALRNAGISPQIGLVTNLTPNHLDWHGTFEHYCWSKAGVFASQEPGGVVVLNADDPGSISLEADAPGGIMKFGWQPREGLVSAVEDQTVIVSEDGKWLPVVSLSDIPVPGKFNVMNVLAALAAVKACGESVGKEVSDAVREFRAIPHRLEKIGTWSSVTYFNDSIATTPESSIAALEAVPGGKILIAGGYDKGLDYGTLADVIIRYAARVILVGAAGDKVADALKAAGSPIEPRRARNLREAVEIASGLAEKGDSVLLSPAAASYDEFRNFTERGDSFRKWVNDLNSGN
ncbi:MAG: UDP-N-acetylmuramoyl-L-alanine--D-glutamate ligase [Planctomycetota bacterium]|jgi:UDP-N-acetylmuramoylalanine--D-glutamate ligase